MTTHTDHTTTDEVLVVVCDTCGTRRASSACHPTCRGVFTVTDEVAKPRLPGGHAADCDDIEACSCACPHCGQPGTPNDIDPCPHCGQTTYGPN